MHAPEDQKCWDEKWGAGCSNFITIDELFTKECSIAERVMGCLKEEFDSSHVKVRGHLAVTINLMIDVLDKQLIPLEPNNVIEN